MAKRKSIGEELYLFTDDTGKKSDNLLISSHGAYMPGLGGTIKVPDWTTLFFYGPHKDVLLDPGIGMIMGGGVRYLESNSRGNVINNYCLSKYQTKDGESYNDIEKEINNNRERNEMRSEGLKVAYNAVNWDGMMEVFKASPNPSPQFDVLTIRNRYWMKTINLDEVFTLLRENSCLYKNIHCIFCRSPLIGSSKNHDPKMNPRP